MMLSKYWNVQLLIMFRANSVSVQIPCGPHRESSASSAKKLRRMADIQYQHWLKVGYLYSSWYCVQL
jgi:hypothetical protein